MECLVTKLKGVVNSNLPKLGVMNLTIQADVFTSSDSTGKFIALILDSSIDFTNKEGECIIEVNNGAFFKQGAETIGSRVNLFGRSFATSLNLYNPQNKDITVTYYNKYESPVIWGNIVDNFDKIDSIKYCNAKTIRIPRGFSGQEFTGLANEDNIEVLRLNDCNIQEGALDNMPNLRFVAGVIKSGRTLPANLSTFTGTVTNWSLGDRTNGNMLEMGDGVLFNNTTDIDNMLIDMSKCTGRSGLTMNIYCSVSYTPTGEDVLSAINILKQYYERIYLYNKDYAGE